LPASTFSYRRRAVALNVSATLQRLNRCRSFQRRRVKRRNSCLPCDMAWQCKQRHDMGPWTRDEPHALPLATTRAAAKQRCAAVALGNILAHAAWPRIPPHSRTAIQCAVFRPCALNLPYLYDTSPQPALHAAALRAACPLNAARHFSGCAHLRLLLLPYLRARGRQPKLTCRQSRHTCLRGNS